MKRQAGGAPRPRGGHLVFVERATEVNREVLEFLREGEPRVAPPPAG